MDFASEAKVPFGHTVHVESPRVENVPTPHATQVEAPPEEYVPALRGGGRTQERE